MKFKKLFFLAYVGISLAVFLSGCSKESTPADFTGKWAVSGNSVGFSIDITPSYSNKEEDISLFLTAQQNEIFNSLKELESIVIDAVEGTSQFIYSENRSISGTFTQSGNTFIIKNPSFLDGIYGDYDGGMLFIYYPKSYMINLLSSSVGGMDPEQEDFYLKALSDFTGYCGYVKVEK